MVGEGDGWATLDREGRVQLPDGRSLYLKCMGSPRQDAKTPAVVLVHGLGGTASEWLEVQRRVAHFARVYLYERGGYHGSDPPLQVPTCANIAAELRSLLKAANIAPPYLLVGHSYGGVLVRQFLADDPSSVFGMVLVDAPPVVKRMPVEWTKLLGPATYEEVVGLQANLGIGEDEYRTIIHQSHINEKPGCIAEKELNAMFPGNQELQMLLHGKQLLGDRRLCVVFCNETNDFNKVYEYGIQKGYGTVKEQEAVRRHLETMSANEEADQRTQLALSAVAQFIKTDSTRATHNVCQYEGGRKASPCLRQMLNFYPSDQVHLVDPGWVAERIRWVLDGPSSR